MASSNLQLDKPGSPADGVEARALGMLTRNLWVIAAGMGIVLFAGSMAIDWLLLERSERLLAVALSNALAALLTAALVFTLLAYGRRERQRIEGRMATLQEVNHHVRNALQHLAFAAGSLNSRQEPEGEAVSEAIRRIHWALREVLPKVEPTFEPFEGSVRAAATRHERSPDNKESGS